MSVNQINYGIGWALLLMWLLLLAVSASSYLIGKDRADKWWEKEAIQSRGAWCWDDHHMFVSDWKDVNPDGGESGEQGAYLFDNGPDAAFCQSTEPTK